jgi:hypothetical protein
MKRARLIVMALLALGALSVGAHPQPASAVQGPPILVTSCPAILDVVGGHYILTGDLNCVNTSGVINFAGVIIVAQDVHFNLNGFTISGDGTGVGIRVPYFSSGAHINGGTVTGFSTGIVVRGSLFGVEQSCHVNGMTVTGNESLGIVLSFNTFGNIINGNTVLDNGVDLYDVNLGASGCVNRWIGNTFETDNETGADFGPGAGCIR